MPLIIEPSSDGAIEVGHTREGVRLLAGYLKSQKFSDASLQIAIADNSNFVGIPSHSVCKSLQMKKPKPETLLKTAISTAFHGPKRVLNKPRESLYLIADRAKCSEYYSLIVKEFGEVHDLVILQDCSITSIPPPWFVKNVSRCAVRFIGKPPSYVEETFLAELSRCLMAGGNRLSLATENLRVKKWLESHLNTHVHHVPWFSFIHQPGACKNRRNNVAVAFFPGAQRRSKGLLKLPELITQVSAASIGTQWNFVLQEPFEQGGDIAQVMDWLKQNRQVTVLPRVLHRDAYDSQIANSDVLVLPYFDPNYNWSGSGTFVDGVINGVPVVAPRVSAIGYEISQTGLGVVFDDSSDIAEAMKQALEMKLKPSDIKRFRAIALSNLEDWLGI